MILLAYAATVAILILVTMFLRRRVGNWVPQQIVRLRILAGSIAAAYATTVVAVAAFAPADNESVAAWAIAVAVVGVALYAAGLLRWTGSVAWGMRLAGCVLLVGVAAVPSHLTLLLPVAATLSMTLFRTRANDSPLGADQRPAAYGAT